MEKQNHREFPNANLLFCGGGWFKRCSETALASSRHKQLFETWTKGWKFGGCQAFRGVFFGLKCFFFLENFACLCSRAPLSTVDSQMKIL